MKNIILLLISITFLFSCKENKNIKIPKVKIERSKFVSVLIDVNLLEGYLTSLNVNLPQIKDTSLGQYKNIFKNYNINYQQYKENYDYYIQQDYFAAMQQEVLDSLIVMEKKYENEKSYKQISFSQYKVLLNKDSLVNFLQHDTILTHIQKVDTILNYYRSNQEKLEVIDIDSLSFEKNVLKLRKSKALFNSIMSKVYQN